MQNITKTKESATRKSIDIILKNLGWETDESSPDCNVYTERTKTVEQNKLLKGKKPDYVLYESGTDNPIAVVEAKKSGQNLKEAIDQAVGYYAKPLDVNIVFATDGSIVETFDIRSKKNLKIDNEVVTEFLTEDDVLKFLKEGSNRFTPARISHTKRELINIFKEANDLLRKEGMREGVERFSEFSNLLFLKLISEIEDEREEDGEKRILEKRYCWESFANKNPVEMLDYINDTILPRLVNKYNHSGDVFQHELLIKNPETLKRIVDKLSSLQLLNTDSDIKGDAFEYFLKNSVTVGNDLGEYFTPRHIIKLIVDLVDPKFEETIYDPACGTGGFLIQAFKNIKRKVKLTKENTLKLKEKTIYGRELTGTARIAKMNMIIIGDGHNNISQIDSLSKPVKEEYDVVLTNFPFSQKTDFSNLYNFNTEDANPVFLQHVISSLKKYGRAGVVVPEGLLFDEKSEYTKIRRILLEQCNLISVIRLHDFVFRPYTGQPTSILIFEKGKQTKKVWFFDVQNDGFKKTSGKGGRPPIEENDLVLLRQVWDEKENTKKSFAVPIEEITKNGYKLSMGNYLKRSKEDRDTTGVTELGELCDVFIGGTPRRNEQSYWVGKNLWVKISDMKKKYITDTDEKITDKGVEKSSVKFIKKGSLLFSFKLTIGKVAFAGTNLYTNEAIATIVPKDNRISSKYLYYLLPNIDYTSYIQRATKGKTLNKDIIKKIKIKNVSRKIQDKIVVELESIDEEKEKLLKKAETLKEKQKKIIRKFC